MSSNIESVLNETRVFKPAEAFVKQANISGMAAYQAMCEEAERDFEGFWAKLAREHVLWSKPFTKTLDESNAPFFNWFYDGELNASYNCLDRHLKTQPDKVAIIFEADDGKVTKITYKELYHEVCQLANALKPLGIKKGDRVLIYMPMSIQVVVAMQACARIGATHSVVFGGFSAKSLQERIIDAGAVAVITADGQFRGGKEIPLKPVVDEALAMGGCDAVRNVIVYKRSGSAVPMKAPRDKWWDDVVKGQPDTASRPGSTPSIRCSSSTPRARPASPRACSTRPAATCCWAILTMKWVFDYKPTDVFWCTADVGWVTGHTYITYGPLALRRDRSRVRGRADLSGRGPLLEDDPGPQGQRVLHRADRDPLADQGGRRPAEEIRPVQPAHPRHRGRADQSRGVDVVLHHGRQRALPDRRYLVADRDRRPHDHAAARVQRRSSPARARCRCRASWRRSSTKPAIR